MRGGRFVTLLLCLTLWTAPAWASPEETLQQAVDAYTNAQETTDREGRLAAFRGAERLFAAVAEERAPGNAELYANFGNAALRAERLGPAVLAYRRALRLDPNHARARQNLLHARTLLPTWVPHPTQEGVLDSFFFWHRSMSSEERAATAALCFLLAAIGFAAAIRWRNGVIRNLARLPALVWLVLTASLLLEAGAHANRQAVIVVAETLARAADSNNAPARFAEPLPGGTEVEILEDRDQWVKIGLANGRDAWVRRSSLGMVERKP